MKPLLKLLHLLAAIGFAGTLVVSLLLAATADDSTATAFAASRRAIAAAAEHIALPSLVLLVLTGMLLVVKQPAYFEARWVWAKALLGALIVGIALLVVQPAVSRASALAQMSVEGSPVLRPLAAALRAERIGGIVNLALSLAAISLAVWRPSLARRRGE
jgi:uncharacterized membrane protein